MTICRARPSPIPPRGLLDLAHESRGLVAAIVFNGLQKECAGFVRGQPGDALEFLLLPRGAS